MFDTEMHINTFVILVIQVIVLFTQFIYYLSKPQDKSRKRFLILTITYIAYNLFSGIFPDSQFSISIFIQNVIAYIVGIVVAVYFIFYIYHEFKINPFKRFGVKTLFWVLTISFVVLFVFPYYLTSDLSFSKKLFISIPLFISISFLYQVGNQLKELYIKSDPQSDKSNKSLPHCKMKILAGYLGLFSISLMPLIVAIGDYQSVEQPVVNFGFLIMTIVYLVEIVNISRFENNLIIELSNNQKTKGTITINNNIKEQILNGLINFEKNEDFLQKNIDIKWLSKKLNTNTKYLSKTINDYKQSNFTNYVNKLRILYAISKLKDENDVIRNYSIKSIAEECGFNTAEAFSRAFKNYTSQNPSQYIKELYN